MLGVQEDKFLRGTLDAIREATFSIPSLPGDEEFSYDESAQLQYAVTKKLQLIIAARLLGVTVDISPMERGHGLARVECVEDLNMGYEMLLDRAFKKCGWELYEEPFLTGVDLEALKELDDSGDSEAFEEMLYQVAEENLEECYAFVPEILQTVYSLIEWEAFDSTLMVVRNKRLNRILSYAEAHASIKDEEEFQDLISLSDRIFANQLWFENSAGSKWEDGIFTSWKLFVEGAWETEIAPHSIDVDAILALLLINNHMEMLEQKYSICA